MSEIKILVVDDHKIIRDGIRLMLTGNSMIKIVNEADSGLEAIKYMENNVDDIDVILMDINMPEMDGTEATQYLTNRYPDIKILALSMHSEETYIMDMIKSGAYGYILKESGAEELERAILSVHNGKKYYSNEVSVTMINSMMKQEKVKTSELSEREIEVLKQIALGMTNKEVGGELNISGRTVETHRRNIMRKLELSNTAEMIRYAIQKGILDG